MENLTVTIAKQNDFQNTYLIGFKGNFDGGIMKNIKELQAIIDEATPKMTLIFEFSELNFLNSYAIGHMVSWHNQLSEKEGQILITGSNKNIEDIFSILGINNLFKTYPDVATALATLK
ncbi:hypothetical protein COY07_06495 [Candidatus Peregrinibacteria bacterium CG_4_10_14_0_2_um_filter_43_11]|nr:MAG: hypothetical protein COY07_06495 [Candidatus Peregrinibacteria bacterium CG_4_10_14_0_2_um_filter_43_11]